MRRVNVLFVILLAFVLSYGCAQKRLNTQSGRPEVVVDCGDVQLVKNIFHNRMLNEGYNVVAENNLSVEYEREASVAVDFLFAISFGNKGGKPKDEVIFNFMDMKKNVKVVANLRTIRSDGNRINANDGKSAFKFQEEMERLKTEAENNCF